MAYNATNWQKGDTITAQRLNNMEGGIEAALDGDSSDSVDVITGSGVYDAGDFSIDVTNQSGTRNVDYTLISSNNQIIYAIGNNSSNHIYTTSGAGSALRLYSATSANDVSTLISVDAETGKKTVISLGLYVQSGDSVLSVIRR